MSAEELLRSTEKSALTNTQHISNVSGKNTKLKSRKKLVSWGATGLIIAMVAVAAVFFSSGNLIPAKIQERLIEETDVQYADMVASKMLALQQALYLLELLVQHIFGTSQVDQAQETQKTGTTFHCMLIKNGQEEQLGKIIVMK